VPIAPVALFRSLAPKRGAAPFGRPNASDEDESRIEIVAPDGYAAALLMKYVSPWFPAEIASSDGWSVTLRAPVRADGEEWVFEVLSLVERWLDAVPLPCATVRYCGERHLIRASDTRSHVDSLGPTPGPAA
jgi:hypothetical protein